MRKEHLRKLPVHFHKNLSTSVDSAIFPLLLNSNVIHNSHRCAKSKLTGKINGNDNDDNDGGVDDNNNQKETHKHMTLSQVLEWFDTSKSEKNCNMYLLSVKQYTEK